MGRALTEITDDIRAWIARQQMFFVATAPLDAAGHVNCSPKGGDAFRVIAPTVVAYQDLTGSGVETISHLRENGRIVVMFCAFEGAARIVRLHGRGSVVMRGDAGYDDLAAHFAPSAGERAIIRIDVTRVANSCGFGVPLYDYAGQRGELETWFDKTGPQGLDDYRKRSNAVGIDGLPGIEGN